MNSFLELFYLSIEEYNTFSNLSGFTGIYFYLHEPLGLHILISCQILFYIWRPPSLSELTLAIFNMELTRLDSEASIYIKVSLNYQGHPNLYFIPKVK